MKNSLVAIEVKINEIIGYFPLMLQPHPSPDWEAAQPKLEETGIGATQRLTQHIPTGFGLKLVSPYPEFRSKTLVYRGSDCVEKFMDGLNEIYDHCYEKLNTVSEMEFTENDHHEFETASTCSICTKEFEEGGELDKKVPDHDHISGKYRGAAHSSCNLKMWQQKEIIVYMHNAKG